MNEITHCESESFANLRIIISPKSCKEAWSNAHDVFPHLSRIAQDKWMSQTAMQDSTGTASQAADFSHALMLA